MKKRFIAVVLIVSMAIAMIVPVHATNRQYNNSGLISVLRDESQTCFVYQFEDGLTSTVSSVIGENGDTIYTITEGDLTDTVRIANDNTTYLNGNKIIVTEDISETTTNVTRDSSSWQTTTCPYGASTDYTAYQTTKYNSNVDFSQTLGSITRAAILLILQGIFPEFAMILDGLAQVVDSLGDDDPTSTCASFKRHYYYHATKGYYVTNNGGGPLAVARVVTACYSRTNYSGHCQMYQFFDCRQLH